MIQQESESWMDDGLDGEEEMGRGVSQQLEEEKKYKKVIKRLAE